MQQQMSLRQYSCNIVGHEGKEIIGMCQNANCSQTSRRVCFLCQQLHWKHDPQFDPSDIQDETQLYLSIQEYIRNLTTMVSDIKLHCDIQNYLLQLEMIQQIQQWSFRLQKLKQINDELDKFRVESLDNISLENYICNTNILGIKEYIRKDELKLIEINQIKNTYLINEANRQIPQEKIYQLDQNSIQNDLQEALQCRNKQKEKSLQQIFESHYFEQVQPQDNPYVTLCETLLKQGFDLKIKNLYEQYEQLKQTDLLSHIEEYQLLYLDAYALYYSQDKDKTIEQQINLINKSIEANYSYPKSRELKKLIQGPQVIQQQEKPINDQVASQINDQVGSQMANSYFEKGYNFIKSKQFQEAVNEFGQAIQMKPDFQLAYFLQGVCYYQLQKHKEAVQVFNQAIALDPQHQNSIFMKAQSLFRLHKFREALDTINQLQEAANQQGQAIQMNPDFQQAYYIQGVCYQQLQRHDEAVQVFNQAIALDPKDEKSIIKRAQSLLMQDRFDEVLDAIKYAEELNPNNVEIYLTRAQTFEKLKKYQEAIVEYDRAIQVDPFYPTTYNNKGVLLDQLERYQDAIDMYDKAIELDPQTYNFFQNKGQSQYNLKKFQESHDSFDKAILLNPKYELLYKLKSRSLVQLGKDQEAKDLLENFYIDNPNLQNQDQE